MKVVGHIEYMNETDKDGFLEILDNYEKNNPNDPLNITGVKILYREYLKTKKIIKNSM